MDILSQIQKAISESGYEKHVRAGVVLTGGGSSLRHLKELCQYTLQCSTRIGIPDIGFVHSIPSELKYPMYATSLGLLKYGIQDNEYEYFVEEERKVESKKQKTESKKQKVESRKQKPENKKDPGMKNVWDSIKGFLDELTEKTS
jgi:cell division protein FtsA